jgi:aspartate/methionine/tyrosine aminotransferase
MSKETLLKREFRDRDVNRLRNIITKKYGNSTGAQVGYEKKMEDHKEGDVWEENSKMWTIKDGLKQTITKLDVIKKAARTPFLCPECSKPMKSSLDKKMYPLHNKCFDCVVVMETRLKHEGKYEEYARNIVTNNILTHIEEAEQFIEEFADFNKDTYVTEQGDIEEWDGGVNKDSMTKKWKEELEEMKNSLKS